MRFVFGPASFWMSGIDDVALYELRVSDSDALPDLASRSFAASGS
jgi:hypothetical protein